MAMLPAWQTASSNAKKNNSPYGITITTTPNNLDVPHGAFCKKIIDNAAPFTYECFDMTDEQLDDYIQANSQNNFLSVQYTYTELGKDQAWFEKCVRDFQGDLSKIKREILLEWPRSTESAVFSEAQLENLYHFVVKDPLSRIMVDNKYLINFYDRLDLNKNYILSCDVSGGLANDNSVICIIDPETFKAIGYFKNNKIDTDSFKKLIYTLMTLYFKNAYLVIENNSYGLSILDSLMKDPVIEPRMYREVKEAMAEKTQKDGFTVKRKTKNLAYGVNTNITTRKMMYDLLMSIVNDEADLIIAPELYYDISMLERKKNGKIEAMEGKHDDCLMAYLIFRYAVFYGKCFQERFGIAPIPTRGNVKVVSNKQSLEQMERLIMNNSISSSFQDSEVYKNLLIRQQQLNNAERGNEDAEKARKLQSFMNICDLNSDY